MENIIVNKKGRKARTSIWDLYKNEITHLLSIDLNIKAIYKILISKMEIDTKPSYDGLYRWIVRNNLQS